MVKVVMTHLKAMAIQMIKSGKYLKKLNQGYVPQRPLFKNFHLTVSRVVKVTHVLPSRSL